jgi:hypothetical protein
MRWIKLAHQLSRRAYSMPKSTCTSSTSRLAWLSTGNLGSWAQHLAASLSCPALLLSYELAGQPCKAGVVFLGRGKMKIVKQWRIRKSLLMGILEQWNRYCYGVTVTNGWVLFMRSGTVHNEWALLMRPGAVLRTVCYNDLWERPVPPAFIYIVRFLPHKH